MRASVPCLQGETKLDLKHKDAEFVANTYSRFPVQLVSGQGALAVDENGKEYIDMGAGIAVNTFGYSDAAWKDAVVQQLEKLQHTSNLYYTQPCVTLAEMLCSRTGMKKVFFSNSGAEANECAIKVARRYSFKKYGEERKNIITLKSSFHGRTIATLAATGQDTFHQEFGPFPEGFLYADPADPDELEKLVENNGCAAIMMELVQGEGGVNKVSREFVDRALKLAEKHDLLIIVDEVQTGNGRTGELFAYMHYGFVPDIVTTAKGLAGGLPLGATLFSEKTADVLTPGSHGSTFGGNPVCCAAAISVLSRIDDDLLTQVKRKSEYIVSRLEKCPGVKSVTGMGLMLGIECEKPASEVIAGCIEKGVLVLSAKTKVRLLPPLSISDEQLEKALNVIMEVIGE